MTQFRLYVFVLEVVRRPKSKLTREQLWAKVFSHRKQALWLLMNKLGLADSHDPMPTGNSFFE